MTAGPPVIVDLCCGTGALGVAVARKLGGSGRSAGSLAADLFAVGIVSSCPQ